MKVKVVKWCWKKWKWPILMHIYDKQCEIMQKKSMEESKLSDLVFLQWDVRSSLLKTWKTTQTKTRFSQNLQILWHIQGGTMSKGMVRAFQICIKYGGGEVLTPSYGASKSTQFSPFYHQNTVFKKTKHGHNFKNQISILNQGWKSGFPKRWFNFKP